METPTITIEEIEMKVIYIRFRGSYIAFRRNARKLFNQVFAFAKKNDLIVEGWTKVMTLYHDNPFITNVQAVR